MLVSYGASIFEVAVRAAHERLWQLSTERNRTRRTGLPGLRMVGSGQARPRGSKLVFEKAFVHDDNEYEPSADATRCAFDGVKAQVWSVGDEPLVSHVLNEVNPGPAAQFLYLDPLHEAHLADRTCVQGRGLLG